ncbi:MAG TPA: aminomethyltransferase beta-barrel domain-containing protein, partial [Steroidobacteraceae bacterium]
ATGHYARIAAGPRLLRGLDPAKDQSYFLHEVGARELARCVFPVGALQKPEVRRIARERGLPVFDKRDSTGICFVGERPFGEFVGTFLPGEPGPIESPDGVVVGRHRGLERYTLGQRSGLGVGGLRGRGDDPWFVAGKDLARNALTVVQGSGHPALFCAGLRAAKPHWISGTAPAATIACTAKVRYRQPDVGCRVQVEADGVDVRFEEPLRGAAPGQYIVFYDGEECLGGAAIMALQPLEDSCRTASEPAASSPSAARATTITHSMRSPGTRPDASPTR